ncbi:MAG TPA: 3-hydroxyacyl-CoA dehydrogenase NAD-binding domain-containing protein [Bdellovibrionota bacterium]|nr:3-hydroxyacyl-CoA dehydrogenase NAD-binding domain-containing protein [Bdellovibrionota bacterium]
MTANPVKNVLVVGAGTMGRGIAHVSALGGFATTVQDVSEEILAQAKANIEENLKKGVEVGKVTAEGMKSAVGNLVFVTDFEASARSADLAIEAIPEDLTMKRDLFERLNSLAPKSAILATNTSALPVGEMAAASGRPDRFIGMHFFNPVHKMKLIEIVTCEATSEETIETARRVSRAMGKETVVVKESPGFVTSRMNALIGNEAFRMLEEEIASPEDIDKAIKLGLNHPMGPFEMVDLVGLDVRLTTLKYLHKTLGDRFRPSPVLEKYVSEGRLGRKTGRGVYSYDKLKK